MNAGGSTDYAKVEITNFIKDHIYLGAKILDVGAGSGTYRYYLGAGYVLDAVEVWKEAADSIAPYYHTVYNMDIRDFEYPYDYDLIIFGDVLEHLTVEDAKMVLAEAEKHAKHILIGIPYQYEQDALYGNEAEKHLQPDLTHEIFKQRYPGYKLLIGRFDFYGYYYK